MNKFMALALEEARFGIAHGHGGPFGAVIVKDGTVIRTFDINIGPEQGDPKFGQYSSTREGVNPIRSKQVLSVSTSYGYEMPYWMGFDGGIGFHYSKYFDQTGYQDTSMGCTILRSEDDARWLFNNTPMGTKVVVYS